MVDHSGDKTEETKIKAEYNKIWFENLSKEKKLFVLKRELDSLRNMNSIKKPKPFDEKPNYVNFKQSNSAMNLPKAEKSKPTNSISSLSIKLPKDFRKCAVKLFNY